MKTQRALLILAMGLPTLAAWSYFELFTSPEEVKSLYSFSKIIQFSLPLISFFWIQKQRRSFLGPTGKEIGYGFLLGALMSLGLIGTYFGLRDQSFMAAVPALIQEKLIGFGADTPLKYLALAVFISAIHSFLEEYYWRWYVYRELNHWVGHAKAVVLSALAFTGHHVIVIKAYLPPEIQSWGIWAFPAFVFAAGVVWSISFGKYQSLWLNWVSHLMADVAILWIGFKLVWPVPF
jgi:uncharacterized protein